VNDAADLIQIRQVTRADAETVGKFVGLLLTELSGTAVDSEKRREVARQVLQDDGPYRGFLAFRSDEPVGVMMLSEFSAIYTLGLAATITELYVVPEYRSRQVAEQLLRAAVAHGRERGWGRLEVGAPRQPQWARSLQFYERNGFREIGPRLGLMLR
jgi:GNAT superfamily N-acetyltransferase